MNRGTKNNSLAAGNGGGVLRVYPIVSLVDLMLGKLAKSYPSCSPDCKYCKMEEGL